MNVFDRLDVLAIEAGCTGIAGTKVNCLWYTENKVLVFKLNWSNLETTLHFGFEQIIQSNVTLTDMVLTGFNSHLRESEHASKSDAPRTIKTPHVKQLETRNAELLEAVKKAHEILSHEMDNGRTPSMLQGVGLGYFEDIICGVKS